MASRTWNVRSVQISLSPEGERARMLFGYPGGAVIDIYDELPRHPELRHAGWCNVKELCTRLIMPHAWGKTKRMPGHLA